MAVKNNSWGYLNHTLYLENMKANGFDLPTGKKQPIDMEMP